MKTKLLIIFALAALAGCNTIAGIGQDITDAAYAVSDRL